MITYFQSPAYAKRPGMRVYYIYIYVCARRPVFPLPIHQYSNACFKKMKNNFNQKHNILYCSYRFGPFAGNGLMTN